MENFEVMKNAWDRMGQAERRKFAEQHKDNANFQQFAKQYSQWATPAPTTPQPSNPQPVENNTQNQTSANGQNWGNGGENQQSLQNQETSNPQGQPSIQDMQKHQFGYQTDENYRKQRDTQFAQQLYQSNPNTFDYNAVFNYVKSQAPQVSQGEISNTVKNIQRQWLQHSRIGAMGTASAEQIRNGLLNGQFSQSDLEILRTQNPEKYQEYLAHDEKMNAMSNAKHNAGLMNKLYNWESVKGEKTNQDLIMEAMEKFFGNINYNSKEIVDAYKEAINSSEIQKWNSKMLRTQKEMDEIDDDLDSLRDDLKRQYPWISKAQLNALVYDRSYKSMKRKNELHRDYIQARGEVQFLTDLAGKNLEADLKRVELQRAEFTDKYNALGFAKGILEFETPQQKRDAELDQIKKKYQLESELTDINSKDPQTQRTALMKALDQYYKDFWSIILRPQSQVVDDILALAKKEGISVGEAMRKNFTEPLQKKPEYRAMMSKLTWVNAGDKMLKVGDKIFIQTTHADGSTSIKEYGGANLWWGSGGLLNVSVPATYQGPNYTPASIERVQAGLKQINAQWDGSKWGQCWYFVNNYLQSLWIGRLFTDPISAKKAVVNSSTPSIGSVAVIDRTNSPNASQAQKKYGHVGVVVGINKDGSVLVKQSNKAGEEKVFTLTYRADQVYGYFDPTISKEQATASMGGEISTSYDNSIVDFLQKDHSKFNSTQWKAIEKAGYSVSEYLAQKQAYQNSVAKEITDTEIALLKDLYEMKKAWWNARRLSNFWAVPWTDSADFDVAYNNFKSNLTLKNLIDSKAKGATFWALSDNELKFLESAASRLDKKATSKKFKAELNSIITNMEAKIRKRWGNLSHLWFYQEAKNQANPNSLNLAGFAQYQINSTPYWGHAEELDL